MIREPSAPAPLWPVSVKAVLIHSGEVLLVRNDRQEWELPGGRLELGESPAECVVREIREESGLEAACSSLLLAESFEVIPGHWVLIVAFACTLAGVRKVRISDEHTAFGWFAATAPPDEGLPEVYRRAIAQAVRSAAAAPPS